jgi:hypothetical protein
MYVSRYMPATLEPETFPSFALQCRAESSKMVSRCYLLFPKLLHAANKHKLTGTGWDRIRPYFLRRVSVLWVLKSCYGVSKNSVQ